LIPAAFDYERATSVEEAVALLARGGDDAKLLAGGHSLLPLMRLRLARPTLLIDIGRLDDLRFIRGDEESVEIGALTTHHDLADSHELAEACPLLVQTASQIGDPQVRHRGTIGGSVAHGDPASDMPAALLALDADLVLEGPDGSRTVAAAAFFDGPLMTALGADEILAVIRVPRRARRTAYLKFQRRAQDWAIVGVAAAVRIEDGRIEEAEIGLTNMGPTPLRAAAVEAALVGASDAAAVSAAAHEVGAIGTPPGDENATPGFRLHIAEVMIRRAVGAAMA